MILRDYQEEISTEAAKMLDWLKICYLSMMVRTGKTLTALAACEKYGAKSILFVTKKKAIQSIQDDHSAIGSVSELTVTNYEQLHNYEGEPDIVVIDEAHCIGQYPVPAERTKLLKKICEGKPIIFLSGSPTPESYSQLYHQFYISSFSPFKEWPSFYKWAKEFVIVRKKYMYNREFNDYSSAIKEKIDQFTKHYFISYTQEEAGFKQMVKEEILTIRMQPGTYWLANKLNKDRVHIGKDGQEIIADTEVKLMQKLHQVYSGSVLAEDGNAQCFDHSKASFIKQHFAGRKIAIFYKFKAEAAMILWAFGSDYLTDSPEDFNNSERLTFYSQISSGREGINLSTADAIVMFNIDFSSLSYQQARARMQTRDRVKDCWLYWVFAENGIEKKIYDRVVKKQSYTLSYFIKDYEGTRHPNQDKKQTEKGGLACT